MRLLYIPLNNSSLPVADSALGEFVAGIIDRHVVSRVRKNGVRNDVPTQLLIYLAAYSPAIEEELAGLPHHAKAKTIVDPTFDQARGDEIALETVAEERACYRLIPYGLLEPNEEKRLQEKLLERFDHAFLVRLTPKIDSAKI